MPLKLLEYFKGGITYVQHSVDNKKNKRPTFSEDYMLGVTKDTNKKIKSFQ